MRIFHSKIPLPQKFIIPPSKSHTMRAILFASMAKGRSNITNFLSSPDSDAMIEACRSIGAKIIKNGASLTIDGVAGVPMPQKPSIWAGNSGQVLRFMGAILSLTGHPVEITGDDSIKTKRPILPLIEGITALGGRAFSIKENNFAPMHIKGPIKPGVIEIDGRDSQPVSALIMAAAFLEGETEIYVRNPGEQPWISLTLDWLSRMNIPYKNENFCHYHIIGAKTILPFTYKVPGDFSSAAYPFVLSLLRGEETWLEGLDFSDVQGDKKLFEILRTLGARFSLEGDLLHVYKTPQLKGGVIDVNECIDALPILAVVGCFTSSALHITNCEIARSKESDRLHSITAELTKMGAHIEERQDELIVYPSKLKGALLHSHQDHRIALSLMVAGLLAEGETSIDDLTCIHKSYSNFLQEI